VGDFGYGWSLHDDNQDKFSRALSNTVQHFGVPVRWFDGNHENFDVLEALGLFGSNEPREYLPGVIYLPRGTVLQRDSHRILVMGGAYSPDKSFRTPHVSWWQQEEITTADLLRCPDQPVDTLLTHDVSEDGFNAVMGKDAFPDSRRNRLAVQSLVERYRPSLLIHGHYHMAYEAEVKGTHYVGLNMGTQRGSMCVVDWSGNKPAHLVL
jgi:UDP-2,3-diacylglucosamine pyrophosphatase LpxH